MEVQEIKINRITYVKDEHSTLCTDCAFINKDCDIHILGKEHTLCDLFDGHSLKVKEEHEK